MDTWRLLQLETNNAFMNMAIDEAILTARIAGKFRIPCVFIVGNHPPLALAKTRILKLKFTLMLANSWVLMWLGVLAAAALFTTILRAKSLIV